MNYLGDYFLERSERRARLRQGFAFDCACEACAAAPDAVAESDKRRAMLAKLHGDVQRHMFADHDAALAGLKLISAFPWS